MVLKNTLLTMANTVMSLIVGIFISSVLLVRTLGAENYGWYAYAMSIVAIATNIGSLGMNTIVVKYANRHMDKASAYYRFAHMLKFSVGLLIAIGIAVFAWLRPDTTQAQRNVLLYLSFVPMFSSWSVYRLRLTTELCAADNTKNNIVVLVLGAACRIVIVLISLNWTLFALCVLIDRIALAALTELSNRKHHGYSQDHWNFNLLERATFLKESAPLFFAGVLNVLYMRIDQIMLYNITSPEILADYSIAVKWTESWYFIPTAFVSSVVTKMFANASSSEQFKTFAKILNMVGTISVSFVLFFMLFGGKLVITLYGQEYLGAIIPLRILAFAGIVATLGSVWSNYVISLGQQKVLLLLVAFSAPGNIILNILLIPEYGAIGAALATVIANVLPLLVISHLNRKLRSSTRLLIGAATGIPGLREYGRILVRYGRERFQK